MIEFFKFFLLFCMGQMSTSLTGCPCACLPENTKGITDHARAGGGRLGVFVDSPIYSCEREEFEMEMFLLLSILLRSCMEMVALVCFGRFQSFLISLVRWLSIV